MRTLAVPLFLLACHHDAPPPTAPAAAPAVAHHTCDEAGAKVTSVLAADTAHVDAAMARDFGAIVVQHCTDDKWSAEVLGCIDIATTHAAMQQCAHDRLTAEQYQKLTDAAKATHKDG